MSWILRKPKKKHQEEKSKFITNGGILLERLIKSSKGKYYPFCNFSLKEIKAATDNFNGKILVDTAHFKVYRGFLDDRFISIMKYNKIWHSYYDGAFNYIVFAAQISHRNALKLIGCCLETELPIIVFESFQYGSLNDRIDRNIKSNFQPRSWIQRLKIGMDIANILTYFHFGFSRPIVFRDLKPSNILLDENNNTKLFGFNFCISIPEDKTYVKFDDLIGTVGYVAPEYYQSICYNEKCDVYSFGAILLFLLTGQRPDYLSHKLGGVLHCNGCNNMSSSYVPHVPECNDAADRDWCSILEDKMKCVENNIIEEITDPTIFCDGRSEDKKQQLRAFANLAAKCCSNSTMDRPTMIDVAKELKKLYVSSASTST